MKIFPEWRRKASLRRRRQMLLRGRDETWESFESKIKIAKTADEKHELEYDQYFECSEFEDELRSIDSQEIVRRGSRCHLSISDFPMLEGETSHWETGNYGARYIHPKTLREFTKTVEAAEHERAKRKIEIKDFWLKIFTATVAALAAAASIATFLKHN